MELIKVGEIIASHGIKGEVKIFPLTEYVGRFNRDQYYYIGGPNIKVRVEKYRESGNIIILKFKEYNDINEIMPFIKKPLYTSSEDLADLEDDEFFIFDLVGLELFDGSKKVGRVKEIIENSTNDILLVEGENGDFYVPFVKAFIKDIDLEEKKIKAELIDGMIDEI